MADLPPGLLMQLATMLTGAGEGSPHGGQKFGGGLFGGNRFGGNTYGGNKFGGNQFGASAPQSIAVPATPPALPAFEQPGGSLPMDHYMPPTGAQASAQPPDQLPPASPAPAPQAMPAAAMPDAAMPPAMPPPTPVGDGSVRGDLNAAIQQLIAQKKLLPEQLRGAFSNQYGEPT